MRTATKIPMPKKSTIHNYYHKILNSYPLLVDLFTAYNEGRHTLQEIYDEIDLLSGSTEKATGMYEQFNLLYYIAKDKFPEGYQTSKNSKKEINNNGWVGQGDRIQMLRESDDIYIALETRVITIGGSCLVMNTRDLTVDVKTMSDMIQNGLDLIDGDRPPLDTSEAQDIKPDNDGI